MSNVRPHVRFQGLASEWSLVFGRPLLRQSRPPAHLSSAHDGRRGPSVQWRPASHGGIRSRLHHLVGRLRFIAGCAVMQERESGATPNPRIRLVRAPAGTRAATSFLASAHTNRANKKYPRSSGRSLRSNALLRVLAGLGHQAHCGFASGQCLTRGRADVQRRATMAPFAEFGSAVGRRSPLR